MQKKDLIALFMESPLYFDLSPKERLFLLQDHRRRFNQTWEAAWPQAFKAGVTTAAAGSWRPGCADEEFATD